MTYRCIAHCIASLSNASRAFSPIHLQTPSPVTSRMRYVTSHTQDDAAEDSDSSTASIADLDAV
eukprot:3128255-Rhodomonas_salina.2